VSKMDPDDLHDIEKADELIEAAEQRKASTKIVRDLVTRMVNPVFQGRTDWLLHWNRKTNEFESVDTKQLLLLIAVRKALHERTINQAG